MAYSRSSILGQNNNSLEKIPKGSDKEVFAFGGTYAVGAKQFSVDAGYARSFDEIAFVTGFSAGGNYSICLNEE